MTSGCVGAKEGASGEKERARAGENLPVGLNEKRGQGEKGEEGEREAAVEDDWLQVPRAAGPGGVGTAVLGS